MRHLADTCVQVMSYRITSYSSRWDPLPPTPTVGTVRGWSFPVARVMPLVKRLAADITKGDGRGKGAELLQSQTVEGPWRHALRLAVMNCRSKLDTRYSILDAWTFDTRRSDTRHSTLDARTLENEHGMGGELGSGFSPMRLAVFYGRLFTLSVPVDTWTSNISPSSSPHPSRTISILSRLDRVPLFYPAIPSLGYFWIAHSQASQVLPLSICSTPLDAIIVFFSTSYVIFYSYTTYG